MKDVEIKSEGQGRMFENDLLEYMTKAPAPVSASIYSAIALGMLYVGWQDGAVESVLSGVFLFMFALFFWTFFEYIFHRYINHIDEFFPESELARKIAFTIHGIHHEYPRDRERLMMPPIPGLLILAVLFVTYLVLLGNWVWVFMPGFMAGYMIYSFIHISVHKRHVPSILKTQYRHHAIHHYKHPEKAFGVSTTLWDRVFGTMPPD